MKITDALKETGKARCATADPGWWVEIKDNVLRFFLKGAISGLPVSLYRICSDDWLPYHPTPEKCEACKEAEEINRRCVSESKEWMDDIIDHLRKYHCICQKEKP